MQPTGMFAGILEERWPQLENVEWRSFGVKLQPYNGDGTSRWRGIAWKHASRLVPNQSCGVQHIGTVHNLQTTERRLDRQIGALIDNQSAESTIELRRPEVELFGGGISSGGCYNDFLAIDELPEVGAHLVAAATMRKMSLLTADRYQSLVRAGMRSIGMQTALDEAGMSTGNYLSLRSQIEQIFELRVERDVA